MQSRRNLEERIFDESEKMRKYICTFCGSCEVFHHCTGNNAVVQPAIPQTVGVCVNTPTVIEIGSTIVEEMHVPATCKDEDVPNDDDMCDVCNCRYDRQLRGFRWIDGKTKAVLGDKLCRKCYEVALGDIMDYIPDPNSSKPACQLVGLAKDTKAFVIERAITMAWCYGRAHRASRLKRLIRHVGRKAIVKVSDIV